VLLQKEEEQGMGVTSMRMVGKKEGTGSREREGSMSAT
jgi:hypothetical protein